MGPVRSERGVSSASAIRNPLADITTTRRVVLFTSALTTALAACSRPDTDMPTPPTVTPNAPKAAEALVQNRPEEERPSVRLANAILPAGGDFDEPVSKWAREGQIVTVIKPITLSRFELPLFKKSPAPAKSPLTIELIDTDDFSKPALWSATIPPEQVNKDPNAWQTVKGAPLALKSGHYLLTAGADTEEDPKNAYAWKKAGEGEGTHDHYVRLSGVKQWNRDRFSLAYKLYGVVDLAAEKARVDNEKMLPLTDSPYYKLQYPVRWDHRGNVKVEGATTPTTADVFQGGLDAAGAQFAIYKENSINPKTTMPERIEAVKAELARSGGVKIDVDQKAFRVKNPNGETALFTIITGANTRNTQAVIKVGAAWFRVVSSSHELTEPEERMRLITKVLPTFEATAA